jgi:hypothetical protein
MGWLDRFLRGRRELLETAEPERAFAPDPAADTWPLVADGNNEDALALIRRDGLHLVSVRSGEARALPSFAGGILLFATTWEPYSATTLGSLRPEVEAGRVNPFGVVLFENTRDEVAASKAEAWYFAHAFVLAPPSEALRPLVARVPLRLFIGAAGALERVVEGKG